MSGGEDIPSPEPAYAELLAASNFSFLHSASHPHEMVRQAAGLGMSGIGIADRNTVAGVVRAHVAWKELREAGLASKDFRLLVGARLVFADGTPDIAAYPMTRHGWGRLTSLLTRGNLRAKKGDCILTLGDLLAHAEDLQLIVLDASTALVQEEQRKPVDYRPHLPLDETGGEEREQNLEALLAQLAGLAPVRVWLGAAMLRQGDDARRLEYHARIADAAGVPLLAVNDALYASPACRPLHDVVTAIRLGTTVQAAGRRLLANAERHLKPPEEMARLFAAHGDAVAETARFMAGISFTLDELKYEYPHEPVPYGWEPQEWLEHLVMEAAHDRYGAELPDKVKRLLEEEFTLIRSAKYAYYFLTVHDVVRYARSQGILCQGRGSAANSIVCFLLGVTSVDPMRHDLLFSRFMSSERKEPPDIDVDFEHERREEVMQYIYRRYGRHRAGIAATVIHYRARSTVREVGKALGLSEDVTARMASTVWGSYASKYERDRAEENGFNPDNPQIARLGHFVQELLEFPRHLSQHVGGFVLTQDRLDEMVPLHNGAMEDRTFIEWDKDDIDALGLMKVDVLALGMLTCIAKGFELMRRHGLGDHNLEVDIECEDEAVYKMLSKGDSIGVFQVESRAQINMLPRLKPKIFYDLVVQVAIVRPGPIEGDMVHPYLRRRCGEEAIEFPSPSLPHDPDELRGVLGKTFGVPIFQEQAMNLAITAANFTSEEANGLRRAMATFRNLGTIDTFRGKLIGGMVARGYEQEFAERCFRQIEGFGSYGFPESHAQSFARLVYVSAWMKCHHPAVFTCALLNSQPMGFYAPAQLVRDLIEHGGEVRPADINASHWDSTLERREDGALALRLGLRQITGFRQDWAETIESARASGRFTCIEELARRAHLPQRALRLLADADALASLGLDRRTALWDVRRMPDDELPLFAAAKARELGEEPPIVLAPMTLGEHVVSDYQLTRLSLKEHPMALLRPVFDAEGVTPCEKLRAMKGGERVKVAGAVLIRQRPGKGTAVFITLEDEGGIANVVLWSSQLDKFRRAVMASRLMLVDGVIQRSKEGVIHVMADRIVDRTEVLGALSDMHGAETPLSPADELTHTPQAYGYRESRSPTARHPRNVRLLPPSRDFR
jgi:error-prone DNA polymerase